MNWHKYALLVPPDREDQVAALLLSLGIEGVEIEDGILPNPRELENMFVDLAPELAPDELPPAREARVIFYLRIDGDEPDPSLSAKDRDDSYTIRDRLWTQEEEAAFLESLEAAWQRQFPALPWRLEQSISREEDWRDNWKRYYRPIAAGGLLILPHWEEIPEAYRDEIERGRRKLLKLEPGTAFGSGSHESTRLCLDALEQYLKGGERVMDIGCGSGIIGLGALLKGAISVCATELDPACESVIEKNLLLNQLDPARFRLHMSNILTEEKSRFGSGYQLIFCNILAPVICALAAPGQADVLAEKGAWFITSGIYRERRQEVEAAFAQNPAWQFEACHALGDWISLIYRKT